MFEGAGCLRVRDFLGCWIVPVLDFPVLDCPRIGLVNINVTQCQRSDGLLNVHVNTSQRSTGLVNVHMNKGRTP